MAKADEESPGLDEKGVEAAARAIHASPAFQPACGPWQEGSNRASQQHAKIAARAGVTAYAAHLLSDEAEAEFEIWQDGMPVASASGPRDRALTDAAHYAMVYGQDGPVSLCEVVRFQMPLPVLTNPAH